MLTIYSHRSIELRSLYEVPKMFHNSYANAGNAKASSIL